MKNITNSEFEELIEDLINKKITRKDLAKSLETDLRTLYKKINEVSQTNPELYKRYIDVYPYQPKARDDIDYEALIIEIIKGRQSLKKASKEYNISIRTISRRMKKLEKINPELIALYREYANYIKTGKPLPYEALKREEELKTKAKVVVSTITQKREEELKETLARFEELLSQGLSKTQAAKELGYYDNTIIWKKYEELKRIETEKKARQTFKESLKVDTTREKRAYKNTKTDENTKSEDISTELENN